MKDNFLLKSDEAIRLYNEAVKDLPIIDYHNHLSVSDIVHDNHYQNLTDIWLTADPYKHRLMRIMGVDEHFITGDATPYEKLYKYFEIFPYLAGNPVYDWSRMELSRIFGIDELPSRDNAKYIYDKCNEMLRSPEFSSRSILSRFGIEYQSPVSSLLGDLSLYSDGVAPSLRADELLTPTDKLKSEIVLKSGIAINDIDSYIRAITVLLDKFNAKGCKFADHSLDSDFFDGDPCCEKYKIFTKLLNEYAKRKWTLLLHVGAKRSTSPRLKEIAGPAGGYAAVGGSFNVSRLIDQLAEAESEGGIPDTVIFPLNMSDHSAAAVLQGSFSECGVTSKVQLGPAWWWCDHTLGIRNTLSAISSFGVISGFIGMTTDSRSILSFVRHDYFRRIFVDWLVERNHSGDLDLPCDVLASIARKVCYQNAKDKLERK